MNKACIFDRSGTLSNNFHCFSQVVEKLFTRFGVPLISDEEIRSSYISPYMKFWNQYIPDLSKTEQDILFLGCMQELERPKIYPGVMETLTFLHDHGRKLFVLSSDHADTLVPEIEHSGLLPLLTESISSDYEKGEQILTLIQRYALDQDATFLVGDTNGDIEAGIFAHVKTVGITWGFQDKAGLEKAGPDYLIDDICELIDIANQQK